VNIARLEPKTHLLFCLATALLLWANPSAAQEARSGAPRASKITGDWAILFKSRPIAISPTQVRITDMAGADVNDKTWTVVHTKYFDLHYQPTSDQEKVRRLAKSMDSIYAFLQGRLGVERPFPIKAFLIPDVRGHSLSYPKLNMIRTGDAGNFILNMGSFLHETTHLFAHQYLEHGRRSIWVGEYMCHYLQTRMRLMGEGIDFMRQYRQRTASRELPSWSALDDPGDSPDYPAAAMVYYFLEEKYGADKLNDFWRERLEAGRPGAGRAPFEAPFQKVFNKPVAQLEDEWRAFWGQAHAPPKAPAPRPAGRSDDRPSSRSSNY
jgi:hypothetical protein